MFTIVHGGEHYNSISKDETVKTVIGMHKLSIFSWSVKKDGKLLVWCDSSGAIGFKNYSDISAGDFMQTYLKQEQP